MKRRFRRSETWGNGVLDKTSLTRCLGHGVSQWQALVEERDPLGPKRPWPLTQGEGCVKWPALATFRHEIGRVAQW